MKIIIAGCGKVGYTVAQNLTKEDGVSIAVIDNDSDAFAKAADTIDAIFVKGSVLSEDVLTQAGIKDADLFIAATSVDETNILACILAKRLGADKTAARVRNPEFALELDSLWKGLGVDVVFNPEYEAAREISRLLRFPTVDKIDTLVGGRVELVSFNVSEAADFFTGKSVQQVFHTKKMNVLLAVVERDDQILIPKGDLIFEKGDVLRILGRPSFVMEFFAAIGKNTGRIKNTLIIGGGTITYYLVDLLKRHNSGTNIKIIDIDKEQCETLSERFPRALIICADGTDQDILDSETDRNGAVVCLTDRDEENTVIALYSMQIGIRKVILKINHINRMMVKNLGIGSIVAPKHITADQITRYVKGIKNADRGNSKTVYHICQAGDEEVEAVEFTADAETQCINTPLKALKIGKGILIGCIVRKNEIIIPSGDSVIRPGDSVIVIVKNDIIEELDDIVQ